MKFCIPYNRYSQEKNINEADELSIIFNKSDKTLIEFLQKYKDKRINIIIKDIDFFYGPIEIIKEIRKNYPDLNFTIVIDTLTWAEDSINELKENNIKFYFAKEVVDWDTFLGYIQLGVCDIIIAEQLGFELDKVSEIAKKNNIQIRAYPNVAQSAWKKSDSIKKFFIRPEDVDFYSQFIDVLEFYNAFEDMDKIPILLKIYKNKKQWYGHLKEIIIGFNSNLDSRFVVPNFAERRFKCGKKCLKGGKCSLCERVESLSETLKENNLIITKEKTVKEENNGS